MSPLEWHSPGLTCDTDQYSRPDPDSIAAHRAEILKLMMEKEHYTQKYLAEKAKYDELLAEVNSTSTLGSIASASQDGEAGPSLQAPPNLASTGALGKTNNADVTVPQQNIASLGQVVLPATSTVLIPPTPISQPDAPEDAGNIARQTKEPVCPTVQPIKPVENVSAPTGGTFQRDGRSEERAIISLHANNGSGTTILLLLLDPTDRAKLRSAASSVPAVAVRPNVHQDQTERGNGWPEGSGVPGNRWAGRSGGGLSGPGSRLILVALSCLAECLILWQQRVWRTSELFRPTSFPRFQ